MNQAQIDQQKGIMGAVDYDRIVHPLFFAFEKMAKKASELEVHPFDKVRAVTLNKKWHSRMPESTLSFSYAFAASAYGIVYAVAMWGNPTARELPGDWIELRRLAICEDAPKNTATYMIARMIKWLQKNTNHPHAISYQDTDVHLGTIYKAANWQVEYEGRPMKRDRSKKRAGTNSIYRGYMNGTEVDHSAKIRWGIDI